MKKYIKSETEVYDDMQDEVLYDNGKWSIYIDGYGIGISDGYEVDRPTIYDDGKVAYDFPERIPAYVKKKMESLVRQGVFDNPNYGRGEQVSDDIKYFRRYER